MTLNNILFNSADIAITPDEISKNIDGFGYNDAIHKIIQESKELDREGEVFIKCTARILSNFGTTRSGPFKGVEINEAGNVNGKEILLNCWQVVGNHLLEIYNAVLESFYSRNRYLLELGLDFLTQPLKILYNNSNEATGRLLKRLYLDSLWNAGWF